MRPAGRATLTLLLLLAGAGWGLGVPFWKMAASAGHSPLGLTVWQQALTLLFLGPVVLLRGSRLPLGRRALVFYAGLGLLGTVLPNIFYYIAIEKLPAGILAITVATVPMFSLLLAALIGADRPEGLRVLGVLLGFCAMALLAAPGSLPEPALWIFVGCGLITAALYAGEANFVAQMRLPDIDPFAALTGASAIGLVALLPVALATGTLVDLSPPWGAAERGLVVGSLLNALSYAGYVWIVGRAGAVFAAQVGYVVTVTGVLFSLLILGERYAGPVWAALALILAGLALVRPRPTAAPAP